MKPKIIKVGFLCGAVAGILQVAFFFYLLNDVYLGKPDAADAHWFYYHLVGIMPWFFCLFTIFPGMYGLSSLIDNLQVSNILVASYVGVNWFLNGFLIGVLFSYIFFRMVPGTKGTGNNG